MRIFFGKRTAGRLHDFRVQSAAGKNREIGFKDFTIVHVKIFLIGVKRIQILHPELATAKHTGLGAQLVAKLALDLIHRDREILVRIHE